jgi:hypothetical protein
VVSFTPWPLYPQRKNPWYPLDRGLGGLQSHSGGGGEENNSKLHTKRRGIYISLKLIRFYNFCKNLSNVSKSDFPPKIF